MSIVSSTRTDHRLGFADQTEEVRIDSVPVTGEVPAWLTGGLVRVTPAQMDFERRSVSHWFDGMAMLNRFGFDGSGSVSYASKFLNTDARRRALETGGASVSGFATDPCRSLFQRVQSVFSQETTDNANVNLSRLGDEYIAMTETPMAVAFDPETLATTRGDREALRFGQITTAHPHLDGETGEFINFSAHMGAKSKYKVYARDGAASSRVVASMPVREPAYMHSFAITPRYAILLENPLVVNPLRLAMMTRAFIKNYKWKPELGVRVHAFDRKTGVLARSWVADPFFVFHTINAFEDGDDVIVDLCAHEDASIIELLELDRLRAGEDHSDLAARPVRLTLRAGAERHAWAGEPVFVPRVGGDAEDDGVVLSVVLDVAAGRSFLLVLDAASFTEIARAEAPHHIPFGFHGQFFSA
jgi:beta,beta-carotene 9',10'-dioxygenase